MINIEPQKLHVLLADDDADDSMLFNEAVEQSKLPLRFTWAEDGIKLLDFLERDGMPDILFLDVNMPYKNGIECLKEIRKQEKYQNLPIVIYSTTNYKVNIDTCYSGGANLYIIKPNTFNDILKMVKKICNRNWTSTFSTPAPDYFIMTTFD